MATGAIKISSNFQLNRANPLDARLVVENNTERNNIAFRYPGLVVYVRLDDEFYYWDGSNWRDLINIGATPSLLIQKNQQILGTSSGNNYNTGLICNINVTGEMTIIVNGLEYILNNNITDLGYFSLNSGVTATTNYLGSTFYWNGIIVGFNLDVSDIISFKGIGLV